MGEAFGGLNMDASGPGVGSGQGDGTAGPGGRAAALRGSSLGAACQLLLGLARALGPDAAAFWAQQ